MVASLLRHMESLEKECNKLRATTIPKQSNSGSNNQITGISQAGEAHADWEAERMETDNVQNQVKLSKNMSLHLECTSNVFFY
jgi:hypothetical protein